METKTLRVGVCCTAWYYSHIEVPASMMRDEAIKYAKEHLDEIPIETPLEYMPDSDELDEENCDFED